MMNAQIQSDVLFERLRDLRNQIAFDKHLPAYCIVPNKTLEEMASLLPTNSNELEQIYGIGKTKLRQYGDLFLAEIVAFREKNHIVSEFALPAKSSWPESMSLDLDVTLPEEKIGPIAIENYDQLKDALQEMLEYYQHIIYTPERLKEAKADRAKLNHIKRAIATRDKEIKDICLEPYYAVRDQFRELKALVDEPLTRISQFAADMEQVMRDEKMVEIKLFYDDKATNIRPWADDLFSSGWFYEKTWGNKTTKDWQWKRELLAKLALARESILEIESFAGIYANAVIAKFIETGSLDASKSFYNSIITKTKSSVADFEPTGGSPVFRDPHNPQNSEVRFAELEELHLTVYVSQEQRSCLLEYLERSGIKHKLWSVFDP